jgi:hypothetical protein
MKQVLFGLWLGATLSQVLHAQGLQRPPVGAIRWDAWTGDKDVPGQAVEKSLGPKQWHYRLPFYGREVSENKVEARGDSQEVMDKEIAYACEGGLDYWAFLAYEPDTSMSRALDLYLSSRKRSQIQFCVINEQGRWGTPKDFKPWVRRMVSLMGQPGYLRVQDRRPLLYLGFFDDDTVKQQWGSLKEFRKIGMAFLYEEARRHGLGRPYVVVMDFDAGRAADLARQIGADAVSSYASSGDGEGAPYADLVKYAEGFWKDCAATGLPVAPMVMSGWDRRPRMQNPVPWETSWQAPGEGMEKFYQHAKPEELAAHLQDALTWENEHPVLAAPAVLIYAWNEIDEGGWLLPTLKEGDARLKAIGKVLKRQEK